VLGFRSSGFADGLELDFVGVGLADVLITLGNNVG
jgi:hypothetical protein